MDQRQHEKNIIIQEWFDALLSALTLVLLLLLFFVRTVNVDGISMEPTLKNNDQLIALSLMYLPERGDIVVMDGYTSYGTPVVKRVIGMGGDSVDVDFNTGAVSVNGETLDEPYILEPTLGYDIRFPVIVPDGHLFLMGDNRPRSKDSRHSDVGFVDERNILGEVVFRLLPFNTFGRI